jgi:hypothetical protein
VSTSSIEERVEKLHGYCSIECKMRIPTYQERIDTISLSILCGTKGGNKGVRAKVRGNLGKTV